MKIYDAITGIADVFVEEANNYTMNSHSETKKWKYFSGVVASLILVVCLGTYLLQDVGLYGGSVGGGSSTSGAGGEYHSFMSYEGPVFPLSTLEETHLTANRELTWDFATFLGFGEERVRSVNVLDSYVLTNPKDIEETVTLSYPVLANLSNLIEFLPEFKINGEISDSALYFSSLPTMSRESNAPENLHYPENWEDYKALMEEEVYKKSAFSTPIPLDMPVIVYRLEDFQVGSGRGMAPTIAINFGVDTTKTEVHTYGFNGGSEWNDRAYISLSVPEERRDIYYKRKLFVVFGDDIENITVEGYQNGEIIQGNEREGTSVSLVREEMTLEEIFSELVGYEMEFMMSQLYFSEEYTQIFELLSVEEIVAVIGKSLFEDGNFLEEMNPRYEFAFLETSIAEAFYYDRIIYSTVEVTIPPHSSIEVDIATMKLSSYDSPYGYCYGFDMVTTIGSHITFTEQYAIMETNDTVVIKGQNFGFDVENEVTRVMLDLDEELYYFYVDLIDVDKET